MKILACVDMHGSEKAFAALKEKAKKVDCVVCAGDFTIFEHSITKFLEFFDSLGKEVLMIHGNHEDEDSLKEACRPFKNIHFFHKEVVEKDGFVFFGYGGGGFSMMEPEFDDCVRKKLSLLRGKKIILVTHAPPYKTAIDLLGESHKGNKNFKEFILQMHPVLVISGHLHENAGRHELLQKTLIMNPGPLGKIIELQ